jgi:hypothetical protein
MSPSSLPSASENDAPARLLQEVKYDLNPGQNIQNRIAGKIQQRIAAPAYFKEAQEALTPHTSKAQLIWSKISDRLERGVAPSLWEKVRSFLFPQEGTQDLIWQRISNRLEPAYAPSYSFFRPARMVAAFAVLLLVIRVTPSLFLAPHSVASSPVILLPTEGRVSVLIGGLWQEVDQEVRLQKSALIQTGDNGSATLILHDDAVLRLAPNTTIALHDLTDRPEPTSYETTLTLHSGRVWGQGFIPSSTQGVSISTAGGKILLNEGSASITSDNNQVTLQVFDRHAAVLRGDQPSSLSAGEEVVMKDARIYPALEMKNDEYKDAWVTENLKSDAVHRREIAAIQTERRIAAAGTLPTSTLYPLKRLAEQVDILMTFDPEAKIQKKLDHANTRLNEAAALLKEGNEATDVLKEYKETVLEVAAGTGSTTALVRQELVEAAAQVAASLPDEQSYALKETVLETSVALTDSKPEAQSEVQEVLISDQIAALRAKVEDGDLDAARASYKAFSSSLASTGSSLETLSKEARIDAEEALKELAFTLGEPVVTVAGGSSEGSGTLLPADISIILNEAQRQAYARRIFARISVYDQPRSRTNQLRVEIEALRSHPQEASILRALLRLLSPQDQDLKHFIGVEMDRLKNNVK